LRTRPGIRSIVQNGSLLVGRTAFEFLARLVYLVVLARFLGPDAYGAWSYALAAYGLALGIASLGLETLVASHIGASREKGAVVIRTTVVLRLGLAMLAATVLAVFAVAAEAPGEVRTALIVAIPALLGRGMTVLAQSYFVAFEAVSAQFRVSFVLRLAEVAAGTAYLLLGGGVIGVIAIHSASWVLEALLSVRLVRRLPLAETVRLDSAVLARLLKEGAQLGLATACTAWLLAGPIILLRHESGDLAVTGQVALGLQIAAILMAGVQALMSAALPVLSRAVAAGDGRAVRYGPYVALIAIGLAAIGGLIGFAVGPWMIATLIGEPYALVGALFGPAILMVGAMVAPAGYEQAAIVVGRVWPMVLAGAMGAIAMSIVMPHSLAAFGAAGALVAAAAGWSLRAIVLIGAEVILRRAGRRET
jgi:O-antigen/teichoic acid export membrane protein